ncbi:lipocalin family protein [Corynebacterium guangdongense]|uniref:Apolipoprotein D and lipocalin family protein n=1 Tax=Corynebacterium guangdongense TaxID=1783348 RepID=A0ABU1ZTU1_9CORY|nr:lipocalin family protein [Corynebacterium guangdongense]MDR7328351.1 apolipoprotein D and lipocalin family protein [Corynebacterium guangdongense]WJZ16928.1 Outer membrane lipoprotein Blc precursor [Corynebacterium guangdongense]
MFRSLAATLAAAALTVALVPAAGAQQSSPTDFLDGGRLAGGSSQLAPTGFSPNPLPEYGGKIDLERYAGTWYQVAAVPQPFTLQCVDNVTAEYAVIDQDTISVRNSCGTPWGDRSAIEGFADVRSDASLRVNFGGIPFQDPNGPVNYRVTWLADDYSLAIVGDPDRRSGFILSRTPSLSAEQWSTARAVVQDRGWWDCAFVTYPVAGGKTTHQSLCALS